VTFAPVQGFIMASRKLRDLYGSSLLISHLARAQAEDAETHGHTVISPAGIQGSRGVPNTLVIEGNYSKAQSAKALLTCWQRVLSECRAWIEAYFKVKEPELRFDWDSTWRACGLHSWEIFHGQGLTIKKARAALAINKLQRDWSAPNWTGESSTLSSAEAVVRPKMGAVIDPRDLSQGQIREEATAFLDTLRRSRDLGVAFSGAKDESTPTREEISLTELVKRLITYPAVARTALATSENKPLTVAELKVLIPERFQRLTNMAEPTELGEITEMGAAEDAATDKPESLVWFMADGDGIGNHLESLSEQNGEAEALSSFSKTMRKWASDLYQDVPNLMSRQAMVVYAGGDDLFGALHESKPGKKDLTTTQLWSWLAEFPELWKKCDQPGLTVSMGLVWADTQVPQREALQHAREAEASAKARGKNRFALRLLYANGNHLEWTCLWDWLSLIRTHYTDREGRTMERSRDGKPPSWRHLAEDLQWLHSRQAIDRAFSSEAEKKQVESACQATARALWDAYFPDCHLPEEQQKPGKVCASGQHQLDEESAPFRASFESPEIGRRFDQWLWDLGRVMAGLEKHRPIAPKIKQVAQP
jgi:CRISPR-associated protein Cmr2